MVATVDRMIEFSEATWVLMLGLQRLDRVLRRSVSVHNKLSEIRLSRTVIYECCAVSERIQLALSIAFA